MEFLDGQTIRNLLDAGGPMALEQVRMVVLGVGAALWLWVGGAWSADGLELRLDARPDPARSQGRGAAEGTDFMVLAVSPVRFLTYLLVSLLALLPRHIKAQLYRMLLESQAAELSARMNAMDAASAGG
jgi:hypothetical protein